MSWYYNKGAGQVGPVSEEEMARLAASGDLRDETLVWRSGFSAWRPWAEAKAPAAAPGDTACSQCGRKFAAGEMVRFGGQWVCADCKPLYLQRVREGIAVGGQMQYGGFWIRFAARLVDGLLMFVVNMLLFLPLMGFAAASGADGQEPGAGFFVVTCLTYIVQIALNATYEIYFIAKHAATPGKMACKLKVVMADGARLSTGRAVGRYFANMLNGFTLGIGYLIAAFDEQKRALHDHICNTRVVRT